MPVTRSNRCECNAGSFFAASHPAISAAAELICNWVVTYVCVRALRAASGARGGETGHSAECRARRAHGWLALACCPGLGRTLRGAGVGPKNKTVVCCSGAPLLAIPPRTSQDPVTVAVWCLRSSARERFRSRRHYGPCQAGGCFLVKRRPTSLLLPVAARRFRVSLPYRLASRASLRVCGALWSSPRHLLIGGRCWSLRLVSAAAGRADRPLPRPGRFAPETACGTLHEAFAEPSESKILTDSSSVF